LSTLGLLPRSVIVYLGLPFHIDCFMLQVSDFLQQVPGFHINFLRLQVSDFFQQVPGFHLLHQNIKGVQFQRE
jgi:hypothetical protein